MGITTPAGFNGLQHCGIEQCVDIFLPLQPLFRLARLAARLTSGDGINAAAIVLGVSRETARTQLKAVFAKTNTHRQAELATLVTRLRPHA